MIQQSLNIVLAGEDLDHQATEAVFNQIMEGQATPAQIGAFLTALRMKGETIEEITACARVMRNKCGKLSPGMDVLEIVGTGGDEAFTFNISTVSAIVVSAGGVPVAKHGNRSVSSRCGAADCLEALGVKIDLGAAANARLLKEIGICFMYAPVYHASMKHAAPVRKEIAIRTIFNILGPLANPAGANMQLLGVYAEELVEPLARVLQNLGVKRGMVIHGHDGLDEITLTDTTTVCEIDGARMNSFFLSPEQVGLTRCTPADLVGGDPRENAQIAREILQGARGPKRDVVLLNAGVCLYLAYDQMTLRDCVAYAANLIDSGKALAQLESFIALSNRYGGDA